MNLVAMVVLAEPAKACSFLCLGDTVETVSPAFVNVPTNAVVRSIGHGVAPEPKEIVEDGVARTDVVLELERHGAFFVLTQRLEEPFRLGAIVELIPDPEEGLSLPGLLAVQVVEEADHTPPTWEGVFAAESSRSTIRVPSPFGCNGGPSRGHSFELADLTDDMWDLSELLVLALPHDSRHAAFAGTGTSVRIDQDLCNSDDPTLMEEFHRSYDVFVEDGSGNRIGPFEVDTRQCGCAGVPTPSSVLALLAAAFVAAYFSRGSRFHARRLPAAAPDRLLEG